MWGSLGKPKRENSLGPVAGKTTGVVIAGLSSPPLPLDAKTAALIGHKSLKKIEKTFSNREETTHDE
jgi:hypothetical protein